MNEKKNLPECDRVAIWKTVAKSSGISYLSGVIQINGREFRLVAFPNQEKGSENHPDYFFKKKKENTGENHSGKPLWYEEKD